MIFSFVQDFGVSIGVAELGPYRGRAFVGPVCVERYGCSIPWGWEVGASRMRWVAAIVGVGALSRVWVRGGEARP
jgi:hypothetical protein